MLSKHRWSLAALGLVLSVYTFVLCLMPQYVFWSPDEGIKYIMLRTFTWDSGLKYAIPYQGAGMDSEFKFYPSMNPFPHKDDMYPFPLSDGSVYFAWPIWFPLFARIPFLFFGTSGIYLIPLLGGWLTSVVAWRITYHFKPTLAPWAVILVGFGTPLFFYSQMFWEHTAVALLGIIAVWVLATSQPRDLAPLVLVSPLFIVSIILRLEMIAFVLAIVGAWAITAATAHFSTVTQTASQPQTSSAITHRRLVRGLAYLIPMGLDIFLLSNLSGAITSRHQSDVVTYAQVVADNVASSPSSPERLIRYITNLPNVVLNYAGADGPMLDSIWLWIGLIAFALCILSAFVASARVQASLLISSLLVLLLLSLVTLLSSQNYRSLHGILLLAPYAAIAVYVLPYAWRHREFQLFFITLAAFMYLAAGVAMILATRVNWTGTLTTGLEWGSRYLLLLYPIMAILALLAVQIYRESNRPVYLKRAVVGIVALMMLVGIQYEVRGLWMLYSNKQTIAGWQNALETRAPEPVVTDLWWLPAAMPTYFISHEMYVVHPEDASEWLALAAAHNVKTFTYATQTPIDARFAASPIQLIPEDSFSVEGLNLIRLRLVPPAP